MNNTPESTVPAVPRKPMRGVFHKNVISAVATLELARDQEFVPLPPMSVAQVVLVNNSGVSIDFKLSTGAEYITVPTASGYVIEGVDDASQISVRRSDGNGTKASVTIKCENKL